MIKEAYRSDIPICLDIWVTVKDCRPGRYFREMVGREVFELHKKLKARGLTSLERMKSNLVDADPATARKLAAIFKLGEEKPYYQYMLKSFSSISKMKIPNGVEAK